MTNDVFLLAAECISKFRSSQGGLRSLCFGVAGNKAAVYALASKTLQQLPRFDAALKEVFSGDSNSLEYCLLLVILGDVFSGEGFPHKRRRLERRTRTAVRFIKEHQDLLTRNLELSHTNAKIEPNRSSFPRALRLNMARLAPLSDISPGDSINWNTISCTRKQILDELNDGVSEAEVAFPDPLLPDFILLPSGHPFSGPSLYKQRVMTESACITQARASGLPICAAVHYMAITLKAKEPGTALASMRVLDLCSAPGSKALHALSYFGHVTANDLDQRRLDIVRSRFQCCGAQPDRHLLFSNRNALEITDDGQNSILLVDPTCSSSGVSRNVDKQLAEAAGCAKSHADTTSLAAFQKKVLIHALTSFPSAQLVVYSTCSVHREENEDVVAAAIKDVSSVWSLVDALPAWPCRGLPGYKECLRSNSTMETDGFFVALFARQP